MQALGTATYALAELLSERVTCDLLVFFSSKKEPSGSCGCGFCEDRVLSGGVHHHIHRAQHSLRPGVRARSPFTGQGASLRGRAGCPHGTPLPREPGGPRASTPVKASQVSLAGVGLQSI